MAIFDLLLIKSVYPAIIPSDDIYEHMSAAADRKGPRMDKKEKMIRLACVAAACTAALAAVIICAYMLWERPPEQKQAARPLTDMVQPSPGQSAGPSQSPAADKGEAFQTSRQDGVFTLLLVGNDDGTGNTDTIMLAKLDTVRHTADFASIPRDTLINVDSPVRKINSVYWGSRNNGGDGISALSEHIRKLSGIEPDCYAVIDLDVFQQAIDELGGIWFDVPERMYYEDGPVIDLQPGYQLLNGEQCMWLCRYRSTYVNGDLDRIEVQHDFLRAAAEQFLSLGSIPNVTKLAAMLSENMDTNMTAANMAYFARQLLMCDSEDINFYTAPNTPKTVHELSYTFLDLYDWLELVNGHLNPYAQPVTEGQLDLVYLHGGNVCCTTVLNGMAYFSDSRQPSVPEPEEEYYEEPAEEYTEPEPEDAAEYWVWPELVQQPESEINMPSDEDWLSFE